MLVFGNLLLTVKGLVLSVSFYDDVLDNGHGFELW